MARFTTYYKTLGVDPGATQQEIEQAYNEKIAFMLSDKERIGNNAYAIEEATKNLDELIEAYKYISNSFLIRETPNISLSQTDEQTSVMTEELCTVNQRTEKDQNYIQKEKPPAKSGLNPLHYFLIFLSLVTISVTGIVLITHKKDGFAIPPKQNSQQNLAYQPTTISMPAEASNRHNSRHRTNKHPAFRHQGKVITTKSSDGYTYSQVIEKGRPLWVACRGTETIRVDDLIAFPDKPSILNYHISSLGITADKIVFPYVVQINGRLLPGQ